LNRIISTIAIALTFIFAQPVISDSAEIKIWTARAIATVLAEIGPQFTRRRAIISMSTAVCLPIFSGAPTPVNRSIS